MRTFIIFFNFLLITLILYSFLTSNIVEQFGSGCSPSQKSAVYKNQAMIDRLFSEMNTVKAEYDQLNTQSANNKILIQANSGKMKSLYCTSNEYLSLNGLVVTYAILNESKIKPISN